MQADKSITFNPKRQPNAYKPTKDLDNKNAKKENINANKNNNSDIFFLLVNFLIFHINLGLY